MWSDREEEMMQDLLVLSHEDYTQLRRELKVAGLDLCYVAPSSRPVRMRWSPPRLDDATLLAQVAQRRPSDPCYRIASIRCIKSGNWLWPDQLTVTFHAVSATQDALLQDYLVTHALSPRAQSHHATVAAAQAHSTPKTYVQVALALAFITVIEVAMLSVPAVLRPPRWGGVLVLLGLSALKFGMVVFFFMHLRYDHRLYIGLFVGGMMIAAGTILALLALFHEPSAVVAPGAAVLLSRFLTF
jgi:cytochrome c oxidase subunit 4